MKKTLILLLIWVVTLHSEAYGQKQFNFKDGKFKIVQFTDIHWMPNSANSSQTTTTIQSVLKSQMPDIAILTGDVVTGDPALDGWKSIINIFEKAQTPFTVTMGNHDPEHLIKDDIYDLLLKSPYYVGEKGPKDIMGMGNNVISIYNSKNDIAALLYCFDSNDYTPENNYGHYDWIHFNQIEWYRKQSTQFTQKNDGRPIPSLAFFHIPLPEYSEVLEDPTTLGERDERICSPHINTGMFASMVEMKDIMGTFVGHDHNNNYIGIYKGIALAYGQSSGYSGYGEMKGSRIIELQEGKHGFNTWVRTEDGISLEYNFPFGYSFTTDNEVYLPAKEVENAKKGIQYNYYEGDFLSVSELSSAKVLKSGTVDDFTLEMADSKAHFGLEFNGLIKISRSAKYRFFALSDDGSQLYIDGKLIVDNDGKHGALKADAMIALEEGYHNFRVLYFQHTGGSKLEIRYSSLDFMETPLPESILFHVKN